MQIDFKKDFDFIRDLRSNKLGAPNHFSIKLGKLIQRAREEKGINLDEFAKKIN